LEELAAKNILTDLVAAVPNVKKISMQKNLTSIDVKSRKKINIELI
jgi:hypothetical protein